MQIIDRFILGSKLIILFDAEITELSVIVGVDNATNHYHNINGKTHDVTYTDIVPSGRAVEINVPIDLDALIIITVCVGKDEYTTMFLNKYMLFKALNRYLAKWSSALCENCEEKKWRTNTLALLLRTRLLEYSYDNNLLSDSIQHYIDLSRVLSFDGVLFESIPTFYNDLSKRCDESFF